MKTEYFKEYSNYLGRDMEFKVYGHAGRPILVFPSQDGRFFDFENQGMVACVQSFIDEGRIQLFCCDSNDVNSWSSTHWDKHWRIANHEAFHNYICEELCPRIFDINAAANGGHYADGIITTGCSMGGSHALNFMLRRPDIFAGCIALSGAYDAGYFFDGYKDDPLIYNNSPVDYIEGMPYDHPYVEMYRNRDIIICCGRGAWEHPMQEDGARMKELFEYKDIPAWVDFWGDDVAHDWPWWLKEFPYYLNYVC